MTHDQFFRLLDMKPFIPYTLRMASGQKIRIAQPNSIAYGGERLAIIARANGPERWLNIALIESVRFNPVVLPNVPMSTNGP